MAGGESGPLSPQMAAAIDSALASAATRGRRVMPASLQQRMGKRNSPDAWTATLLRVA